MFPPVTRRCLLQQCGIMLAGMLVAGSALSQAPDRKPVQIRYYASVCPGVSPSDAQETTNLMVQDISDRVQYPAVVRHYSGATSEDLLHLGQKLEDGQIHLAALWGIEYGWLKKQFPRLECLVLADLGDATPASQLLVRKDSQIKTLADLEGKKHAYFNEQPIMEKIFLIKLLDGIETTPEAFFGDEEQFPTAKDALWQVYKQKAACCMINVSVFVRLHENQKVLNRDLAPIPGQDPQPYPLPGLFGRRDRLNTLRKGLWEELIKEFTEVHRTREGQTCVNFWRISKFIRPLPDYEAEVKKISNEFPLPLLNRIQKRP